MSCSAGGLASDCQASCIVKAPNASAWDTSGAGFNESSTVVDRFVYALAEGVLQRSLTAELTSSVNCTADTTCKNSIVAGSGCTLSGVDLTQTCVAQVDFECARQQTSANSADSQSLIRDLVQQHKSLTSRFLRAYRKAVDLLNSRPDEFQDLLIQKTQFPSLPKGAYKIPRFPGPRLPSEQNIREVEGWLAKNGITMRPLPYDAQVAQ